ncbi:MAG: hypothetical protein HQL54_03275 [Magnetococcales bacterium]|nr:hypothetical protein [Magnetococcales bacterium]
MKRVSHKMVSAVAVPKTILADSEAVVDENGMGEGTYLGSEIVERTKRNPDNGRSWVVYNLNSRFMVKGKPEDVEITFDTGTRVSSRNINNEFNLLTVFVMNMKATNLAEILSGNFDTVEINKKLIALKGRKYRFKVTTDESQTKFHKQHIDPTTIEPVV